MRFSLCIDCGVELQSSDFGRPRQRCETCNPRMRQCVCCGDQMGGKAEPAVCRTCRSTLTPEQKHDIGLIKYNSLRNCVACGVRRLFPWNTETPCCLSCRRSLSHDEKVRLGVCKPRQKRVQQPWSERKPKRQICQMCGGEHFAKNPKRVYCDDCLPIRFSVDPRRNQRNMAKKRARKVAAFVEDVDPTTLFERDGWRCHICGKKCRQDVDGLHPQAPTIDHVIPLSKGGEHSYKNTACAHRRCNVSKGARDIGQQLAIVG